jgi:PPM family protein phosphatase
VKTQARNSLTFYGLTDTGKVRAHNEDRWLGDPGLGLFVVADGMGGQAAGALAAGIVVETLPRLLRQRIEASTVLTNPESCELLREILADLSGHLRRDSQERLGLRGMGATVVVAVIRHRQALVGHLGDSRAYLLRNEQLERLTHDHSVTQLLLDHGEITDAESLDHPARGQLTRFVGMEGEALPDVRFLELQPEDRLLLCTDGLSGMLSDEDLRAQLIQRSTPEEVCRNLVSAANEAEGKDNITAVVVDVLNE